MRENKMGKGKNERLKVLYKRFNFWHHKAIPVEYLREFSHHYRYSIGTILIFAYLAFFSYFIYYFYTENTTTQFVAIEEGSNSCTEVVRPLDGTFFASSDGYWEGTINFKYTNAPVSVIFRELSASPDIFQEIFSGKKESLQGINEIFSANTLAVNIIYWTNYKKSIESSGTVQTFQMVGDPAYVFDAQIMVGNIASEKTVCNAGAVTTFDSRKASFVVSYEYKSYLSPGSNCVNVFSELELAYAYPGLTVTVAITVDTRSFMTAMAINRGILQSSTAYDLEVYDTRNITTSKGVRYSYSKVEDTRYPGMGPIYCVKGSWCAIQVGRILMLPVFDHFLDNIDGSSTSQPCSCEAGNGNSAWCNTFDFVLGMVAVGDTASVCASCWVESVVAIQQAFDNSYVAFNDALIPAAREMVRPNVTFGQMSTAIGEVFSSASLLAIRSIKLSGNAISQYAYELVNGSCNTALDQTISSWDNLAVNPPLSLVEPYIKCYRDKSFSLFDAFGIGMADSDLIMRLFAYILLPFILIFLKHSTGKKLIEPSEKTLESFVEVLHKAKKRMDMASPSGMGLSLVTEKDIESAGEVIRLLSIGLQGEEEDEEKQLLEDAGAEVDAPGLMRRSFGSQSKYSPQRSPSSYSTYSYDVHKSMENKGPFSPVGAYAVELPVYSPGSKSASGRVYPMTSEDCET